MQRTIVFSGLASFLLAFLGAALALSLFAPASATAQPDVLPEVRASAFTLVGADGTVLAELAPTGTGNVGRLILRDAAGTQRVSLVGTGVLNVFDQDGTTVVFRAGRSFAVGGGAGLPALNGVELGPDGSIGTLPAQP